MTSESTVTAARFAAIMQHLRRTAELSEDPFEASFRDCSDTTLALARGLGGEYRWYDYAADMGFACVRVRLGPDKLVEFMGPHRRVGGR